MGGNHVLHSFESGIQVTVDLLPRRTVHTCVELCVHRILQINDLPFGPVAPTPRGRDPIGVTATG